MPPLVVKETDPIQICEPVIVDGFIKMAEDLTAKPYAEITESERAEVKRIGEEMHNRNLVNVLNPQPPEDPGTTFKEAEESRWFEANLNEAGRARRAEKAYQEGLNKPKSLDAMDWGASEEAKDLVDEKKQEKKKKKELEEAALNARKVEQLQKEREEAYNRMWMNRRNSW